MLISPEKRPRVMILMGRNKSLRIGRTREYKIVKTKLAISKVVRLENPTVGNDHAKTPKVNAVINIARNMDYSIMQKMCKNQEIRK